MTKWKALFSPLPLTLLLLLIGCTGPQTAATNRSGTISSSSSVTAKSSLPRYRPANYVVAAAQAMLGIPYRYGGSSVYGFDCSGLVFYAYSKAGIPVPRTSSQQYQAARKVHPRNVQPGDILFFRLNPPKVSHVGIYTGENRFIHAPSSSGSVFYASLDNSYWRSHLVAVGRFQ